MTHRNVRLSAQLIIILFITCAMIPMSNHVTLAADTPPVTVALNGSDHSLYVNHGSGFIGLGGQLLAAPAVVALPGGNHLYIVTGFDHHLYERTDVVGWQLLGPSYCIDNPATTLSGTTLFVACQGSDHGTYYTTTSLPGSGLPSLGGFTALGGGTNFGPAVALVNGVPTFFVVGGDGAPYWRTTSQGWSRMTGWCTGHLAVATAGSTSYLACHGGNNTPYYATNTGSGWSGFQNLGGSAVDGPGIAATSAGPVIFVEGSDSSVYQNAGGIWRSMGGVAQYGVAATSDTPAVQTGPVQTMLNILNQDRAQYGVAPLTINWTQTNGTGSCPGSYGHSVDMAASGSIWHVNASYPLASFPTGLCIAYTTAGENVGMSQSGNELNDLQVVDRLMMSEPHDAGTCSTTFNHACNILNPTYHQVGIGIYNSSSGTWLTEDFTN